MKKTTTILVALMLGACSGDVTESGVDKVEVDDPVAMLDPDGDGKAEVTVEANVASMQFELGEPLPEIDFRVSGTEDGAVMDVIDALSLVVSSPRSGISASLVDDGNLVAGPPNLAGEWSVDLSEDRRTLTISWYNETPSGLTMKSGEDYDVMYSLDDNCCIEAIESTSFVVSTD